MQVHIIDYGFTTSYLEEGSHIQENDQLELFAGNLLFASINQLEYNKTSRKDDLMSLIYLMIYILSGNMLPGLDSKAITGDVVKAFCVVTDHKKKYSPK